MFLNFILWTFMECLHLLQHSVWKCMCFAKSGKILFFKTKHKTLLENSEDSLASSCVEFSIGLSCNPVWDWVTVGTNESPYITLHTNWPNCLHYFLCAVLLVCHVTQYETGLLLELGFRVTQKKTGLLLELSHSLNENQPMHQEKRTS